MTTHAELADRAAQKLKDKFGSLWQAAGAFGPDQGVSGSRLLMLMRQQPPPVLVRQFVENHTGINLSCPVCQEAGQG